MHKNGFLLLVIFVLASLIFGCGQPTTSPETKPVDQFSGPESATRVPTEPPEPTATPIPPTDTPLPPTDTPLPTDTSTEIPSPTITPTFSPMTLTLPPGAPVKIGTLLWMTNPIGIDSLRGVEIALNDFGGEILGHKVELLSYDDECSQLAGQRGSQILALDDTVVGIIGTSCSRASLVAAKVISDKGKVMISPSNTGPEFTAPDSHESGYFRTSPNDIQALVAISRYAYEDLGFRKLATIFYENNKMQRMWSNHTCQALTDIGGDCVLERAIPAGKAYLAPAMNALLEATPDFIHITFGDPKDAAALIAEIRANPDLSDITIAVWEPLNSPEFLTQAGENAVGIYVSTTSYEFDRDTPAYQAFIQAYQLKYGEEPVSISHAFAYDATTLLLKAIAQVAVQHEDGTLSIDPLATRDVLYATQDYPGLTGNLTCSPYGDCAGVGGGNVYQFTSGDPETFNPGPAEFLSSNPSQVWP